MPLLHAGFPAASIFKLVTAAAALEHGKAQANTRIPFAVAFMYWNAGIIFPIANVTGVG